MESETTSTFASITYLERNPMFFPGPDRPIPEKPYMVRFPVNRIPGAKQSNLSFALHANIPILDLRKHDISMKIDTEGFQLGKFETRFQNWNFNSVENFDIIKGSFFHEVEQFAVKSIGGTWAEVYACDIRRRASDYPQVQFSQESQPLRAVHCDHSNDDGKSIVDGVLNTRGEKRPGRAQLLTIWKPLQNVVRDWPLGLCDYQSIDPSKDVIDVDLVFPDGAREGSNLFFNEQHKWWFLSDQTESEVWLIKTYDSAARTDSNIAPFAPHAAFEWKNCPLPKHMRESIETRVVVYTVAV